MMKYKLLQLTIVENLIAFLDEVQEETLMGNNSPEDKEKIRFCNWAIKKLLDAKDAIVTQTKNPDNEEKLVNRYDKIDEKFYDWKLPEDMSEKEFDKMLNQFDNFLRKWEEEYNKKHPDKPSPKRSQNFKPPHIDEIAEFMSLDEIKEYLLDDPELTDEERFDLYYEERERERERKNSMSYDELLRKSGIKPAGWKPRKPKKK